MTTMEVECQHPIQLDNYQNTFFGNCRVRKTPKIQNQIHMFQKITCLNLNKKIKTK